MPLKRIYIARHGFRANWVTDNWVTPTNLPRDPPLAAFGETQSEELAEYFASLSENERPTAIFSSGFYRCMQTIAPTARKLNLPINIEPGIQEWFSPVAPGTGLHPRPVSAAELRAFFSEIDADTWSPVYYPPRKGEEVEEVHDRAARTLEGLSMTLNSGRLPGEHERIVLCTHAATAIALVRALLNEREYPLRIGCCTVSIFDRVAPADQGMLGPKFWKAIKLGDGSHLKQGAQRDWGFEDIELENGKVVLHPGVPGSENEEDTPVGPQFIINAKM